MVKKKIEYRHLADVAAAYGLKKINGHEAFCGLWINVSRIRFQRAAEFMIGYSAATSNKDLPAELFDGLARFEHEAESMAFEVNAQRATRAALNKLGM